MTIEDYLEMDEPCYGCKHLHRGQDICKACRCYTEDGDDESFYEDEQKE